MLNKKLFHTLSCYATEEVGMKKAAYDYKRILYPHSLSCIRISNPISVIDIMETTKESDHHATQACIMITYLYRQN